MPTPLFLTTCINCRAEVADARALITVPDGTPEGLRLCALCASECEPMDCCPECGSEDTHVNYFDLGLDPETGYHDEAAIFTCADCGASGDAEELVERPAIARPELVARKQPAAEVARAGVAKRSA